MANNSRDEFLEVFLRHQRQVYSYIASLLPYGDDADEVFQQTCLILWEKWDRFNPEADFVSLACGVAFNELRNHLRRKSNSRRPLSDHVLELVAETHFREQSERAKRTAAFTHCFGELKPAQRELVERSYASDSQMQDIADELGVSPASLYMKIHRIRKKLTQCIDRLLTRENAHD